MATSHSWFATDVDLPLVLQWLRDAGAHLVTGEKLPVELPPEKMKLALHFPEIGPLHYWPDEINLSDYPENSQRWRNAVLQKLDDESSHQTEIDADRSACAGLQLPVLQEGKFWVSGELWFPTTQLRKTFPELARVNQRFERWLTKFPLVYDYRVSGKMPVNPFRRQLCEPSVLGRVFALPDAHRWVSSGGFLVSHLASRPGFKGFRVGLQMRGLIPPDHPEQVLS